MAWCIHEGASDDALWPTWADFFLMNYEKQAKNVA